MMMVNKMPVGRTASKIARVVVANSEASAQRGLTTRSKNVVLASRSALAARHGLSKLPVMKLPQRSLVHATRPVLGAAPGTATQAELDEVTAATILWRETVTCGLPDAPEKTAALYAEDAVFWGTVSEGVRDTPELVYDYFDYFARVPGLRMVEFTPTSTRILGDFAVQAGQYTFAWENADGSTTEVLARFNFTFRKEADNWKIIHHHSSAMPAAPDALKPVEPKPDAKWIGTTPEMKAVAGKTIEWKDTVTLGTEDAPEKTAALYAPDAVFWGTVSEQVRNTPEQVYDYFDFFARVPGLRLVEYTPEPVRMFGDSFAIHAGSYVFCWDGADGETVRVKARFTFSYRKEADGSWKIIEHHSSKMPDAPPALKPVVA